PVLVDVRTGEDYEADPRLLPGSCRREFSQVAAWAAEFRGQPVIVLCQKGLKLSDGVAAYLCHEGVDAQTLEGGFVAWRDSGQLLVNADKLPRRDEKGRTLWVTRARPKIDRIACPWLIRRFVDRGAKFLFVTRTHSRCQRAWHQTARRPPELLTH